MTQYVNEEKFRKSLVTVQNNIDTKTDIFPIIVYTEAAEGEQASVTHDEILEAFNSYKFVYAEIPDYETGPLPYIGATFDCLVFGGFSVPNYRVNTDCSPVPIIATVDNNNKWTVKHVFYDYLHTFDLSNLAKLDDVFFDRKIEDEIIRNMQVYDGHSFQYRGLFITGSTAPTVDLSGTLSDSNGLKLPDGMTELTLEPNKEYYFTIEIINEKSEDLLHPYKKKHLILTDWKSYTIPSSK